MKYTDLTLMQRIHLKGFIQNDPQLAAYKSIWLLWGYVKAIEYFLNDDINQLTV